MQRHTRADITDGYSESNCVNNYTKSINIIIITNAMFRWKCPVSTCQKTLSMRGQFLSKSLLIVQQRLIHSLVDKRVSIWSGCRGSQGELFCSSVIILPSLTDFEGMHHYACRTSFRASLSSTLCPELAYLASLSHCIYLTIYVCM